ncbi:MAG TPA: hypothetical protein VFL62_01610 [Bradyrhizobium sp.]|uniref:hypothetical protein n=1 Tax=Bradyrhizobium sp. TaxID=376 RepID=UPI002D7ED0BD|nr:hypothetical protein [Bradyrhizobium sp.]HET7884899.1 hypothetical protein [Bradyrhizobium sp.]
MADDAFALSPISARAAQPSEADYDAIQEAFMETSRGRWFLGEYAKRNRNADTRMVLDAVARIEETLAASKKPERDPLLDRALESLRDALMQAREAAQAAVADLALEQNLMPVRKGARVIREIAWRLREIGADGRICDLIDSQVTAIEGAAAKMAPADLARALTGAFDQIEQRLAAFDASEAPASAAPVTEAGPPQAAEPEPVALVQAEVTAEEPDAPAETVSAAIIAPEAEAVPVESAVADQAPVMMAAEDAAAADDAGEPRDAFDAHDEALLDMVAMEMAAPDTDAAYEPEDAQIYEDQIQESHANEVHQSQFQAKVIEEPIEEPDAEEVPSSAAAYEIDVTFPETRKANGAPATASALPVVTPLQGPPAPEAISVPRPPAPDAISVPAPLPETEPSLGSSLIANGIVQRPRASRPDPLAPIRRMSQTEKIAFFS